MQFVGGIVSMLAVAALLGIGNLISIPGTGYTPLNSNQILWVIGLGVSATLGHAFIVWAAGNAPANLLAPFQYVEIIGAATLGYLVFGDIPASSTLLASASSSPAGFICCIANASLNSGGAHPRLVRRLAVVPDDRDRDRRRIDSRDHQIGNPWLHERTGNKKRTCCKDRQDRADR